MGETAKTLKNEDWGLIISSGNQYFNDYRKVVLMSLGLNSLSVTIFTLKGLGMNK